MQTAILMHTVFVEYKNCSTKNEVNISRHLASLLNDWHGYLHGPLRLLLFLQVKLGLLVLCLKIHVSAISNNITSKIGFASVERIMQDLVIVEKYKIKDYFLYSWLQLLEKLRILNGDGILTKLCIVKFVNSIVNV